MSPCPCMIKDQPSKLKKLQRSRSKNKKERTPGRLAPSRAYTICNCLQYTPHTTWNYSSSKGYTFDLSRSYKPCQCPRYTPMLPLKKPDSIRRNPGRMDGISWNGSSFICSSSIDARTTYDAIDDYDLDELVDWEEEEKLPESTPAISLLDIARPAKPRGIAKHFEIIESVQRVIPLEDLYVETDEWEEDEDWVDLYADELDISSQGKTYSAVVQENY